MVIYFTCKNKNKKGNELRIKNPMALSSGFLNPEQL